LSETFHPTRFWSRLDDGRVRCEVCPRLCTMHEGQRGLCFVRSCHGGEVVSTSFGRSSGYCVDPVEKKPLNHFFPGTPVLSFGTAGCNLACSFCQNWDISKSRETDTLADEAPPELIARAARELGCRSVAFTYNDPVIFLEYAVETAKACRARGIRSIAVTAGFVCEDARREFFSHMDAANVDLKAFDDAFYRKRCSGSLGPVLDTLRHIRRETSVWLEITTLLIPGANDSAEEIDRAASWIAGELGLDVPWHFSAFHPDYRMRDVPATSADILTRAREIALGHGLRYVYTGNVHDESGGSTYCHVCQTKLVGRDWYVLSDWNLDDDGHCTNCGEPCAGVFEGPPGDWGAKRMPVRLADFAPAS
jgi:pyruvate formate lyase activating enzyme